MWAVRSSPYFLSMASQRKTQRCTHGRVTSLGLASLPGEDDQPRLVLLEPLDVELLALLRLGPSSGVDGDTEGQSLLPPDTGELELRGGETTALCEEPSATS